MNHVRYIGIRIYTQQYALTPLAIPFCYKTHPFMIINHNNLDSIILILLIVDNICNCIGDEARIIQQSDLRGPHRQSHAIII